MVRTAFRTCPLCEAGCGLEIDLDATEQVVRIRGDKDDVFSHGYICPKGSALKQIHEDPDRLRRPLIKKNGKHVEVSWDEAWEAVRDGFAKVIETHGRSSLAVYLGNPGAHNLGAMMFNKTVVQSLGSFNRFSASTVDQMPKHVAAGFMFGTPVTIPVPDLDRTDYLLLMGSNPYASNGSVCTAPDFPGRLEAIRARGGKVVVVDPRRTRTAQEADEWISIRPGTDGLFLAAIINVLYADGLVDVGDHIRSYVSGIDELGAELGAFTPELVESATGISADVTRRIAHELAGAPTAAVNGRIGVNAVQFGSVNAWLVDAVNTLTGNLDKRGGAMFALPATGGPNTRGTAGVGNGFRTGKGTSRVRKYPEVLGEFPVATLAEEITTPGAGQIRAFITLAGNPVLSTPDSDALDTALSELDFMVSVDIYLNETSRHADVILPPPSQLQRDHYDLLLLQFAVRNVANYSEQVLAFDEAQPDEWEILAKLGGVLQTLDTKIDPSVIDDIAIDALVQNVIKASTSNVYGRNADEILECLSATGRRGPARMLDFMLQTGPYGAGFGAVEDGLSLQKLLDNPHGVDLGELEPRIPEILRTPTGMVELCPAELRIDLVRLFDSIAQVDDAQMLLIGRRHLKSNNSWMHNINVLTKGNLSCTLQVHPDDAMRLGLSDGINARITSRVGTIDVPVEVTESIRRGVVSLPHGWGHNVQGARMSVAAKKAGVNSNVLTDSQAMDPLSGTSVLNGIPVVVQSLA
ncbi:MAG: molybdopterin oxidoreductase family protein [Ilumatobacteraceae bacterium]|nr:molybdopterin oxidoreductase family protein [Ilumatobacteraceae bacterium]